MFTYIIINRPLLSHSLQLYTTCFITFRQSVYVDDEPDYMDMSGSSVRIPRKIETHHQNDKDQLAVAPRAFQVLGSIF